MIKNKKTTVTMLSTLSCLTLFLSACGSSSSTANGGQSEGPVTLKVLSSTIVEKPAGVIEQQLADEFMKQNPNIKIEFMGTSTNDAFTKITTLATGNQLPDIFVNTPDFYSTANDMGITANLTELLGKDYVQGFNPKVLEEATIDGKLQFAPWFTTPLALLYRMDWLEAEGLKPPTTWDEFIHVAQKLTKDKDGDGKADQWGFGMVGTNNSSGTYRFMPILHSFGASELKQDASGKWVTEMDTPQAAEALQFFGDLVNKYQVVQPGAVQSAYADVVTLMGNEKIGMMITGSHGIGGVIEKNPNLKGKIGAVPVPMKVTHASALSSFGFSISEQSKHKEAAVQYLKFLLNKENALKFFEGTGRMPTRTETNDSPLLNSPEYKGFIEAQKYAFQQPVVPFFSKVQTAVGVAYQSVLTSKTGADEAGKKAAEIIRGEIKQNQK
ncbi:ABC transporter substrate-binding protein [Paenibacillus piri]|uniref:Sugar ABC transporter substrate-binding protein n=1 Tax=Paenibacillus piri TaxID=2547395 RepID=A0A4V6PIE2_9BACL|nr:sugar ABC transporter substrate-binding protein [Paenibacillus piri]TDF93444.1 sugar ABC transporter substrate-binding protein [Paenibacillus piri]